MIRLKMLKSAFKTALPAIALSLALAAAPGDGFAHHSFAMYDQARLLTITGTVKDFQWSNPHSLVWLIAGGLDGQAEDLWSLELPTSPGNLSRMGWSKHSLKPGDRVTVEINPLRDGRHGGSLKKITVLATGEVLITGVPAAAPAPK